MYKEIGQRIRTARKAAGLTLAGLGKELGVTYQQIQKYETGHTRQPIHRLVKAAEVLNVSVGQLIGIEVIKISNVKRVGELEHQVTALKDLCKQKDEEIKTWQVSRDKWYNRAQELLEDNKPWWRWG